MCVSSCEWWVHIGFQSAEALRVPSPCSSFLAQAFQWIRNNSPGYGKFMLDSNRTEVGRKCVLNTQVYNWSRSANGERQSFWKLSSRVRFARFQ